MATPAPTTRADWAHQRLRAAILTGELAPGTKLLADELAHQWQVSPTPLREAFQRLGGTGLVELTSQRGARVAPFSLADIADLYDLRLLLEPRALEQSLRASDDAHRSEIAAAFDALTVPRAKAPVDPIRFAETHLAFHAALLSRCPSVWLRRMTTLLGEHSQRYQLLGAQYRRGGDPQAEHRALCDAAVRGRIKTAVQLLTAHLQTTLDAARTAIDDRKPTASRRS